MPTTQTSLNSFFGVKSDTKKQTTLSSFVKKKQEGKENNDSSVDTADDTKPAAASSSSTKRESPTKTSSSSETAATEKKDAKRRKRVIEDDSSDDDDDDDATCELNEVQEMDLATTDTKKPETETTKKAEVPSEPTPMETDESKKNSAKKESVAKPSEIKSKSSSTKSDTSNKTKTTEPPKKAVSTATLPADNKWSKEAAKLCKTLKLTSNETLLEELSGVVEPGSPIPYQMLTKEFEKIDNITGRLEIQAIMTKLFRQVILTTPQDLYSLIYLASNSVAPAYECVELGIGDSILIKAIGEAYGTKPGEYLQVSYLIYILLCLSIWIVCLISLLLFFIYFFSYGQAKIRR